MRGGLVLAALLLSACAGGEGAPGGGGLLSFLSPASRAPQDSISVYGGSVTVRGPNGYCVDPAASRATSGFAVMASCARTANADRQPRLDALITAQVGRAGSAMVTGSEPALSALLAGPTGRDMLSDGQPVAVSGVDQTPGVVFVNFTETESTAPVAPPLMRAFFDIGDRLVTVSIRPVEGSDLDVTSERLLIAETIAAFRSVNAGDV
ncbi:hypothetical protein [Roseisalinus antarcticus]|nr:hypothetical protein [Roseisalinus antarcticus]